MGYSDIRSRKQHEEDAARIRELERQLKREREDRRVDAAARSLNEKADNPQQQTARQQPQQNQTVIVRNEGCLAGAGKGCLSVIGLIFTLAIIGKIIELICGD